MRFRLGRPALSFHHNAIGRRTLVEPPRVGSGPLMERRPDRELPPVHEHNPWLRTAPVFIVIMTVSMLGIFNYQKSSSSVVTSSLYSLRVHPKAREVLGDEIYFKHKFPWIWGRINQLSGNIDISYSVKGTRGAGMMTFKSIRRSRLAKFETQEWSLETSDGQMIQLLEPDQKDVLLQAPDTDKA